MRIFVDTDVIIDYLRTKRGLFLELLKLESDELAQLYCSPVTVIELFTGESSVDEEQTTEGLLKPIIIVNLDKDLAKKIGEIRRKAKQVALGDLIIGASAISVDAQLATNSHKHFSQIPGLKIFKLRKKLN